jgi:hypothetical protein
MTRTGYLILSGSLRLLSILGGLWIILLTAVAAAWSSQHLVAFWVIFGIAVSGTLASIFGAVTVVFRRRSFTWIALGGSCAVALLGAGSLGTNLTSKRTLSASLSFVAIFFILTFAAPAFAAVFCVRDLRRTKSGDPKAAAVVSKS